MKNMKKILSVFLIVMLMVTTFVGCLNSTNSSLSSTYDEIKPKAGSSQECFVYVRYDRTLDCNIVYDNSTKVMYAVGKLCYDRGIMTVLVDENGKPKLYKGK